MAVSQYNQCNSAVITTQENNRCAITADTQDWSPKPNSLWACHIPQHHNKAIDCANELTCWWLLVLTAWQQSSIHCSALVVIDLSCLMKHKPNQHQLEMGVAGANLITLVQIANCRMLLSICLWSQQGWPAMARISVEHRPVLVTAYHSVFQLVIN